MSIDEIAALPVEALAERDAHLYLWTVNACLEQAYAVARAWGFDSSTVLTWCKAPMGIGLGGTFINTTEFVLFCRRGSLPARQRIDRTWWQWPRQSHSVKPEHFLDIVEQVSPGPYVELFARRHRLGWDVWGNESANTAQLGELA
jgi:N6-adenosine-specific RNA methylase IME4